jgi:hypothetical protein
MADRLASIFGTEKDKYVQVGGVIIVIASAATVNTVD